MQYIVSYQQLKRQKIKIKIKQNVDYMYRCSCHHDRIVVLGKKRGYENEKYVVQNKPNEYSSRDLNKSQIH